MENVIGQLQTVSATSVSQADILANVAHNLTYPMLAWASNNQKLVNSGGTSDPTTDRLILADGVSTVWRTATGRDIASYLYGDTNSTYHSASRINDPGKPALSFFDASGRQTKQTIDIGTSNFLDSANDISYLVLNKPDLNSSLQVNIDQSALSQAIQNVRNSIATVSNSTLTIPGNATIDNLNTQQRADLNALSTTITQLQTAVNDNSVNVQNLKSSIDAFSLAQNGRPAADTTVKFLNDLRGKLTSNDATTSDIQTFINRAQKFGETGKTMVTNALNVLASTQKIDGIINGDANGNAVTAKVGTVPTSTDAATIASGYTVPIEASILNVEQNGQQTPVKSLKKAVADVQVTTQKLDNAKLLAAAAANAQVGAAAAAAANSRRNSAPTILPTAKAGLIAFFGKHQSVSVEYQYYFRNTNPSFTSGEVTLNYAYYFGGK
ncbi:hypothetical protein BKH43_07700 [Helicobacter sp. 13S00401-1]|uniref:hypothetical protein n=1 Tax=Helicobacter sp. 13S00401-1 TaxID=1905758 RepID=UPI000BA58170|nr:hypothetical protein [Helicobacter sp. 13S00401-1]PAF48807.1 hypothetical protein BKH43_07700 [Helicobacter sp. 13S00401-1]